ncbi:MAG: DUF1080 domain-containing protein [Verrucomicrobia bacterium]|nr:DUF1080 domain-containing protein [Verrucomicrobiota bacterium]
MNKLLFCGVVFSLFILLPAHRSPAESSNASQIKKLPGECDVQAGTGTCCILAGVRRTDPVGGRAPIAGNLLTAQRADGEFDGWKTFHEKEGATTGDVWRLQPDGVLVCKGQPRGYLYTEASYTNFTLRVEWRYPAGATGGKGGVLVRMTGEHAIWPRCFECQLNQGAAGDVWAIRGYEFSGPTDRLKVTPQSAFGVLRHLKRLADAEKPAGEWNTLEAVVDGPTITQTVNGKLVNRATGCEVVGGKILLTSEGTEIHFRNVRLKPK